MHTVAVSPETLRDIYISLYEMNLEAAEEDYLEYFQASFSPSIMLSSGADENALRAALSSLLGELADDLGDEEELKRWFEDAGGSESLYKAIASPSRA